MGSLKTHKVRISTNQDFVKIEKIQKLTPSEAKRDFRIAFQKTVLKPSNKLSVEEIAAKISCSPQLLYNAANPHLPYRYSALNMFALMDATQDLSILDFFEKAMGRYAFEVPLSRDPDPEKMLENIFKLKILWEQLLVRFEKFYASGTGDRAVLGEIAEGLFTFINTAAGLRAAAFMRLDRKEF
ncbi:MAG: phage regulatory CII family protein [Candidatus Omnitrophota bacterium]|jgi:hypothetical protein